MKSLRPYQLSAVESLLAYRSSEPILINASVGSGKSLIIAEYMRRSSLNILCLTMNSELVRNNALTYEQQGGLCGIYCSGLDSRDTTKPVIFATPHSAISDIRRQGPLSRRIFDVIIVDECHNITTTPDHTMYHKIFRHYDCKVIGLTGTPYRGKSISIVGPDQFFKKELVTIQMNDLMSQGFLVSPLFGIIKDQFEFSKLKVNSLGNFNAKELREATRNERLTARIMSEVIQVVRSGRNGAFIFAATIKHAHECLAALPKDESALIIGTTPESTRTRILDAARSGEIQYLVNVNCLTVGIDIPNYDVVAWLRPTESLTLYVQGIGRGLRLHPNKQNCVVLDYAGNIDRHGDVDDPLINEAIQQKDRADDGYCIQCYQCGNHNRVTARRCIGVVGGVRCSYFFNFKPCQHCSTENDIAAKYCRECEGELIDPNTKLRLLPGQASLTVDEVYYTITSQNFIITHHCGDELITEHYYLGNTHCKNIFYANFVKKVVEKPSAYYMKLNNLEYLKNLASKAMVPIAIVVSDDKKIKKKIFPETQF